MIWMFNGKRSHSLIGVLATVCAFYITRLKRPSWPVLGRDGVRGRTGRHDRHRLAGQPELRAVAVGIRAASSATSRSRRSSRASTSPTKTTGESQVVRDRGIRRLPPDDGHRSREVRLRLRRELPPRLLDVHPPDHLAEQADLTAAAQWINAWIAGSEMERDEDFTGPAIGILGATQFNGGAIGTLIVLACIAILLRTAYEYLRLYADVPWVQFWWAITYLQRLVHGRQRRSRSSGFTTTGGSRRFRSSSSCGGARSCGRRRRQAPEYWSCSCNLTVPIGGDLHDIRRVFHQFRPVPPGPAARPGRSGWAKTGDRLIAYEVAGREQTYPWSRSRDDEPFEWITLFPDRVLETIEPAACRRAMVEALDRDQPDVRRPGRLRAARIDGRGAVGQTRSGRPAILMSESQAIDRPARLVERADQEAATAPVRRGARRRARRTAITWSSSACRRTASPWATTRSTTTISPPGPRCWRERRDGRSGLPAAPYFLDRLPVRAREEPGPADPGIRALPRAVRPAHGLGPGPLRRRPGGRPRSRTRSRGAAAQRRSTARAFSRPTHCRAGTLTPRHSCCRVSPSPGDWSSTRPPPAACRSWSRRAPAARPRSCRSRKGRPAAGSIRSTSRR